MRVKKGKEVASPTVLYKDHDFMVIDKPAGWVVNDADTTKDIRTVQQWIKSRAKSQISDSKLYRGGIVHRLDKETSGILVVARNEESFGYLQELFRKREIKKHYLALLHGHLREKSGEVEISVGRLPWNRRRFGVLPGGRDSKTSYKLISYHESSDGEKFSLVEFTPTTGRTHQIRIHAKFLGHPIVSDEFYAGRKTARKDRRWCGRLFLHASKISFSKMSGGSFNIESPLPADLVLALDSLEKVERTK